jgi:hypothetical protein
MTHAQAAERHAVERYLLGELSAEERDQFEEHLFDCLECAVDVKAAAIFLDTSRSVLRTDPADLPAAAAAAAAPAAATAGPRARPSRRRWFGWLDGVTMVPGYAAAALPALLIVLGLSLYQNIVTIPALRISSTPRALSSFSFVSSGARAGTPLVIEAPPRQPFLMFFDIPPGGRFASYHCTIVAEDGTPQVSVDVSAAQARDTVQMFIPASRLHPGPHALIITGAGPAAGETQHEIARYPFVLQGSH